MAINSQTTTDPTVNNDSTQGFTAGSTWLNVTSGKLWVCTDASVGAAVWVVGVSASPMSLATAAGAVVGDNALVHPLRTLGKDEPEVLDSIRRELKVMRLILADAFHSDLTPEDIS